MNSKMVFGKSQVSPKKRKTSFNLRPINNRVIFEVGNTSNYLQEAHYNKSEGGGKNSVAFEASCGRRLFLGSMIPKPAVVAGQGQGQGHSSRPMWREGPIGLQYLARSSMSPSTVKVSSSSSPAGILQKPLSASVAAAATIGSGSVNIQKPYFFVSHACVICCKTFQPGDAIFMFQDNFAFCTKGCRDLQMNFFEQREELRCRLKEEREAAAKSKTTYVKGQSYSPSSSSSC